MAFNPFKKMMGNGEDVSPDFIEIDLDQEKSDSKILIKTFSVYCQELAF